MKYTAFISYKHSKNGLELVFEKERKLQKEVGEKIGLLIPIRP